MASLQFGQFWVLGKVTDIHLDNQAGIDLMRRSFTALFSGKEFRESLEEMFSSEIIKIKVPKTALVGPTLELLPLAIYV